MREVQFAIRAVAWLGAALLASDLIAAEDTKRAYRIIAGGGFEICKAYLRNLRAFGPDERDPVCDPRPHPGNKDFTEPRWESMSISQNIEIIYKAEMSWGIYLNHPERHQPFETWRKEFEDGRQASDIHPSLKRTYVEFVKGKPMLIVAYSRSHSSCEADFSRTGASENTGYRFFFYDEDRRSLNRDGARSDLAGAIMLFRGRPFFVNSTSLGDEIYLWQSATGIPAYSSFPVYSPFEKCRYDVDDPTKPASMPRRRPLSK